MINLIKKVLFFVKNIADKILKFCRVRYLELGIVAAIFIPIGSYAGYEAGMWMVADPQFCEACHVHDYANEAWEASIHGQEDITCHDCHHQSLFANVKSAVYLVSPFHDSKKLIHNIPVVKDHVCSKCHDSRVDGLTGLHGVLLDMPEEKYHSIAKINESKLHKIHLNAESRSPYKTLNWNIPAEVEADHSDEFSPGNLINLGHSETNKIHCRDCHGSRSNRAHNFAPVRENCEQCHNAIKGKDDLHSHPHNRNCLLCHVEGFVTDK